MNRVLCTVRIIICAQAVSIYTPRPTKLEGGGYIGFTLSVRPSVCLSVRLETAGSPKPLYGITILIHHIKVLGPGIVQKNFFRVGVTPRPVTCETLPHFEQFSHFFMCRQPFLQTGFTESQALSCAIWKTSFQ